MKEHERKTVAKIEESANSWDSGQLGCEEEFAQASTIEDSQVSVDEALGLKIIPIRLPEEMIEDLKTIAQLQGFRGYQALIKDVLDGFIEDEQRRFMREALSKEQCEDSR